MLLLFVTRSDIAINFPLSASRVSSLWLLGHIFVLSHVQFISDIIWLNVSWNAPTWQAKNIISSFFTLNPISFVSRLPTCNQSASEECWFVTPKKKKPNQIYDSAFGLGQVINWLNSQPKFVFKHAQKVPGLKYFSIQGCSSQSRKNWTALRSRMCKELNYCLGTFAIKQVILA